MNKRELIRYFEEIAFHPSHRMGQNFLVDANLSRKLVELAELDKDQCVVEIGPGMGMITREILKAGATVTAVEKDQRLVQFLKSNIGDGFDIVHGDAVSMPLAGHSVAESLKVIANPPFAITGPWLAGILDIGFPKRMALLLQKEAVERITAREGSKQFGVLAIRLEAAYTVEGLHSVPPQSFYPAPTIDSQIVVFQRKENPVMFEPEFLAIVQRLFTQRRKQIGGGLKKLITAEQKEQWGSQLEKYGLSLQCRPEQIPTHAWVDLNSLYHG